MGLRKTILRPVAYVAGVHATRQTRAFLKAHERTAETQQRLLERLLAAHAETAFGRDHGFAGIRTWDDFVSAVPISTYESLGPYVSRVLHGETTALLPPGERVEMFSMTSGTTGEPKYIPVTRRFLAEMRRGWNIFGLLALRDHPEAWLRPILQISSPMNETTSPTGLPCGAISGMLAATQKRIVRRMYVVPHAVFAIDEPAAKYYTILRCGIGRDVSILSTANPSSTLKLIEAGQDHTERLIRDVADGTVSPPGGTAGAPELGFRPNRKLAAHLDECVKRDGVLLPRHFWDLAFLTNWTGGTLKLYLRRQRELFGDVPLRDIGLLASEGRLSIPISDGTPAGVAEITANVLEFIPAEQRGRPNPMTLRAHEVEVGGEYFLVMSNWAGLWRYNLDDRVRVADSLGDSPVFEFLCRGLQTANITGEKITEDQVVEAMRRASERASAGPQRFVVQGRFTGTPFYELRLERMDGLDCAGLAELVDDALSELNVEYRSKRKSGRLGPIRAIKLAPGTLERREKEEIRKRRGRSEQYKHQYLLTDVIDE